MIFKNRSEAGSKLAEILKKKIVDKENLVVVSILRGGVVVGEEIAKKLKIPHLFLPVVKIPASDNPELAIGAFVFDVRYINKDVASYYSNQSIEKAVDLARNKFKKYSDVFQINKQSFNSIKNQIVILVDDGAATGATTKAAAIFLQKNKVKKIILALPVASSDFERDYFDEVVILHQNPYLSAVSQYYQDFSPVSEDEIKKLIRK